MKKVLSQILGGVLVCASLMQFSGCGEKTTNKIQYYTRGSATEMAVVEKIISAFENTYENEGYEVELIVSDNYIDNLKIFFGAGEEPDIFLMRNGYIESFVKEGLILNLQPYIQNTSIAEELVFTESDLWDLNDGYRYDSVSKKWGNGDLYAVIKDWSPDFAMIYNKDMIDDFNSSSGIYTTAVKQRTQDKLNAITETEYIARGYKELDIMSGKTLAEIVGYPTEDGIYPSTVKPMSWAQNELMCFLLTAYSSTGNIDVYGSALEQDGLKHLLQMVESVDGSQFSASGTTFKGADNENVLSAYQHFVNYQYGSLLSAKRYNATVVDSEIDFKNKNAAVIFDGLWAFSAYNLYGINYGVAPAPTRDGTDEQGNYQNYHSCFAQAHAVSSTTKNPELCWKFLKFYSTYGMRLSVEEGFNIPGNKTIAQSDFLEVSNAKQLKLNQFYMSLASSTFTCKYSPFIDDTRVTEYISTYLPRATKGEVSVATALTNIASSVNRDMENMVK